jgi:hypothetical protein
MMQLYIKFQSEGQGFAFALASSTRELRPNIRPAVTCQQQINSKKKKSGLLAGPYKPSREHCHMYGVCINYYYY